MESKVRSRSLALPEVLKEPGKKEGSEKEKHGRKGRRGESLQEDSSMPLQVSESQVNTTEATGRDEEKSDSKPLWPRHLLSLRTC